jgi:hypothetical protein
MRSRAPRRKRIPDPLTDAEIIKRSQIERAVVNDKPRLLYWSGSRPPHLYVRDEVPEADRGAVVDALASGQVVVRYMGYANCRICKIVLGSCDMLTHGMIYPQKAEHYLEMHRVWTRECDELLRRIRAERGPSVG